MKIKLLSLEELGFVQIDCLGQDAQFKLCSSTSKYIQGPVFSIFQHCFELSSMDYDYFSPVAFTLAECITLRNHLVTNQARIDSISNPDELEKYVLKHISGIEFINGLKDDDPDWKISWEKTKHKLLLVGEDLIEIIDYCIDEDCILWVKGF